jgi:hypothetical protein
MSELRAIQIKLTLQMSEFQQKKFACSTKRATFAKSIMQSCTIYHKMKKCIGCVRREKFQHQHKQINF